MSLENELQRAEQARQILNNELYQETVAIVRQAIIDKWIAAPMRDREGQHELKLMLKLLGDLAAHIETTMQTGKMAELQLESERRMGKLRAVGL